MWVDKPEDEESKKTGADTGEGPSVGAGAGGGAPTIQGSTTAAVGTPSSMSPTPEAPGQKFGTIQDYFKGSKSQGDELGQQFVSKLDATKQQEQGAIGDAASNAAGQISSNTIGLDKNLLNKTVADPTAVANNGSDYDKFMQQWNASYKGPESFESTDQYTKAAAAAQAAKDKATQASSTGGRQQILQDEFGVYGQGNKGLDESLIQNSGSFGDVATKANDLNSLQDYLQSQSKDIQGKAQAAKTTTDQTKQATQDALLGDTGAVKSFKNDIDVRTAQERAKSDQNLKDLQNAVSTNANLTDQQLAMLGTTRDQYNNLLTQQKKAGLEPNLKNYLTTANPDAQISRESVANTGDFAKDQALAKLTGGSNLLGQKTTAGKLVDFQSDKALQDYLDKIGADKATRDATERQRIADQQAEQAQHDAERTAKREDTQNTILGDIATGGVGALVPGIGSAVGAGVNKAIDAVPIVRNAITTVDKKVTQPVVNTVKTIAKTVKQVFCFDGNTMIDMVDGSKKAIKDIQLGDRVKVGGTVLSTRQSLTGNGTRYDYCGTIVTGSHAVKEKRWIRVKDSANANKIEGGGVVYSLVTSLHRICANGVLFADEHETDMYEYLDLNESLAQLNKVVLAVC